MIVKTGANYQVEGGYIEASKKDGGAIVNINGVENEILDMNGKPASIVTLNLKKPASFASTISFPCVYSSSDGLTTGSYSTGAGAVDYNVGVIAGVRILLSINPATGIKAGDGTNNCEIIQSPTVSGRYYLSITGPDPVIVFEEAE